MLTKAPHVSLYGGVDADSEWLAVQPCGACWPPASGLESGIIDLSSTEVTGGIETHGLIGPRVTI